MRRILPLSCTCLPAGNALWKLRQSACRSPSFRAILIHTKHNAHALPPTAAQRPSPLDRMRRFARGARWRVLKQIRLNPDCIGLQVCQKHVCDLRLRLSETTKSTEFAHVDFAAVPEDDMMSVAPSALCNLPASPPILFLLAQHIA